MNSLSVFIGLRYTGARRRSRSVSFLSAVSMVGLAVGVSLLILVLSVMNGFDRELKERILGLIPQAAIYHRANVDNWPALKAELEGVSGVEAASPFVQLNGLLRFRRNAEFVSLWGFDPEAEKHVSLIDEYVDASVAERISNDEAVIVLGKGIADNLSIAVGDKLMLVVPDAESASRAPQVAYFEVGQVIESKTELDSKLALMSIGQAAAMTATPERVSGLRLKVADLFEAPTLMYQITQTLGPGYYSSNWTRTHWNLYQAIQMSKNLVGLLMSLIVAIAAFNVISTLVLVVVDKQGDIAILRTLGASGRQIMAVFMTQGVAIGFIGTLLGLALGCGFALIAKDVVAGLESLLNTQFLQSDVYPLTFLPIEIRFSDLLTVTSTAFFMSFLATIYPAWKAARVQPAVALRYE